MIVADPGWVGHFGFSEPTKVGRGTPCAPGNLTRILIVVIAVVISGRSSRGYDKDYDSDYDSDCDYVSLARLRA